MKLWTQTLAWIAAIAIALLLALFGPEATRVGPLHEAFPQGATAPR
jgi:hypothetical protein